MHGVKKDTSEAVKEKEKKRKETKLKLYREGMANIFERRKAQLKDWETLHCVSDVLRANPDVYTLWNIRKEILLHMIEEKSIEDPIKVGEGELRLTESCLKANPKSYCAWHHRLWILDHFPELNLKLELALCNKYLKLDSRNFHCWNYRRFVGSKLGLSSEDELSYTMEKIDEDFSNYSSWHYRSKLLPLVYSDPAGIRPIKEDVHLRELDLVQNAAFTDPNDQSAWFYLRWLLGRLEPELEVVSTFITDNERIYVAFNRSTDFSDVRVDGDGITKWELVSGIKYGLLWSSSVSVTSDDYELLVTIREQSEKLVLRKSENFVKFSMPKFDPGVSPKLKALLQDQLRSCDQLLELEPESKWPLLTSVVFMKAIDTLQYRNEIVKRLDSLVKYDSYRSSYYTDMKSKFLVEEELKSGVPLDKWSPTNLNLTSLHHTQYIAHVKTLDLSGNNLSSISSLCHLVNLDTLVLDHNQLTSLQTLPKMPKLTSLSVAQNRIAHIDDVKTCLNKLPSIENITLVNNPFVNSSSTQSLVGKIKSVKPALEVIL